MALKYRINVLDALKSKGFTTYRLRKEKILSESTLQKLRTEMPISWENLETLCKLLECQPDSIIYYEGENNEDC